MRLYNEKSCGIFIIIIIVCIVAVIAFVSLPGVIFFYCMITDNGGKLDNADKISTVLTENQETLQDIVSQILNPEQELSICINVENKSFQGLGSSRDIDERLFNLEDIYCLSEGLDIKEIYAYKNPDVNMVIFITYTSGIAGSSEVKGFFYLDRDLTEDIFQYGYFQPYRSHDYSEITDNWYYFDISY